MNAIDTQMEVNSKDSFNEILCLFLPTNTKSIKRPARITAEKIITKMLPIIQLCKLFKLLQF